MVKHQLTMLAMAIMPFAFNAQSTTTPINTDGKVGINTETPTRTLDINGDLRVRTLEETEDFGRILVPITTPSTDGTGETNVVKYFTFKGTKVANLEMSGDLVGGAKGEGDTEGKFEDNSWKGITYTPIQNDYVTISSARPNIIYINKAGFYQIAYIIRIMLDNEYQESTANEPLTYANATISLNAGIKKSDGTFETVELARDTKTIMKGASIRKAGYTGTGEKTQHLSVSAGVFLTKGSYIRASIHTFGMPGVVTNDKYRNFVFKASLSEIKLIKNL